MGNSFQHQGPDSDIQPSYHRLIGNLHVFKGILDWLANFIRLTDAEQNEAGVYFDYVEDEQISKEQEIIINQ
jgi:hypothetical protein